MNVTIAQPNPIPNPHSHRTTIAASTGPKTGPGSRVSLACLPCRSRHVRCDATKPICERCASEGKSCLYAKSRRGGLDRVALLAAKRKRAEGVVNGSSVVPPPREDDSEPYASSDRSSGNGSVSGSGSGSGDWTGLNDGGASGSTETLRQFFGDDYATFGTSTSAPDFASLREAGAPLFSSPDAQWPADTMMTAGSADLQSLDIARDIYIDRYYQCFHRCHPFLLPRRHLETLLRDVSKHAALQPLIITMRYVGSLTIAAAQQSSKPISQRLLESAATAISEASSPASPSASGPPSAWLLVQAHVLYSIAFYWQGDPLSSRQHLDSAVRLAYEMGLFRHEFAAEHAQGNPVMQESMRRTWWQIFTADACFAAIKRQHTPIADHIIPTVGLPCEDDEYESGNIPPPKTLDDYDAREFASDDVPFSSLAHFIGAVRDMTTAIKRAEFITSSQSSASLIASSKVLEEVDAIIDGWMLLVPENKKHMIQKNGEVDEHIFSAYMGLYATTVGLHRQFSECYVNPLEQFSRCAAPPNDNSLTDSLELTRIHTLKCTRAAEAQIRLLAMPARPCSHSPFTVCMLTTGTLSLLAACKFLLRGEKLAIARDQIRASIGYHKAMAEVWLHAKDNLEEVQMIARDVLAIGTANHNNNSSGNGSISTTSSQAPPSGISNSDVDQLPPSIPSATDLNQVLSGDETGLSMAGSLDSIQTCWNLSEIPTQMDAPSPWWIRESEIL